jgi:hypothetical protein
MKYAVFKKFCLINSKILKMMLIKEGYMLRKGYLLIIILALFLPLVLAQSDELFDYHGLQLDLSISNHFNVIPTSPDYLLDYVSAELSWYPREDYRQEVDFINTEPEAAFVEDTGFFFEWNHPEGTSFLLEEKSSIRTKNEFVFIKQKVDFPIKDLDPAYSEYLAPRDIIDINEDIKQKASELVQGQDGLYGAVFSIASWVEDNIKYNLSTITSEANQKASWVLDYRKGVCDEITSIFIALCRSVGIPARFVTGISYSNINLQNDGWGPHGWAEVYFPGFGWVPFDVTYKELGFVDATHIKLKTSFDAKEVSIDYSSKSRNTEIKPGQLEFEVNVANEDYKANYLVDLEAEIAENNVGFGSYNLLIVNVNNPNDYYITTSLSLANVNELEIISENPQQIMLRPGEKKRLYWIVRLSSGLDSDYIYTFPLKVKASRGEQAEAVFKSSVRSKDYSESFFNSIIAAEQLEKKPYSKDVIMTCSLDKQSIYLNDSVSISCQLNNTGNSVLKNLKICLDNSCSSTKVQEEGSASYDYTRNFTTLGVKTLVFKAENDLIEKAYYVTVDVKDIPLIEIVNLTFPRNISYKESSEIKFFVKRKSNTEPRNMKIRINHKLIHEEWDVPVMDKNYGFTLLLRGEGMNLGKNYFNITINYEDDQGKAYSLDDKFTVMLNNPNLLQKLMIWLHTIEKRATDWFSNI